MKSGRVVPGGGNPDNHINLSTVLAPTAAALYALEKMGQATVDHMANFQQLLNAIAA